MGMFYMISYNEDLIWNYSFSHVTFLQAIQLAVEMTVKVNKISNKLRTRLLVLYINLVLATFPLLSN